MKKVRIDNYLFENNFTESREKAKRIIMAGQVLVNDEIIDKPGTKLNLDKPINIRIKQQEKYVSRGGYKLEKIIENNNIKVEDLVCLDVGSSTGGFTDCLLQNKAKFVW